MRFDLLIKQLNSSIASEHILLRRVARYVLPLLLLPLGPAVAQIPTGWLGLFAGGLVAMLMLAQAELFIRPSLERARVIDRDITYYLGLEQLTPSLTSMSALHLLIPSAAALLAGAVLFIPAMMDAADPWQRFAALLLVGLSLWTVWQRLAEAAGLLERVELRLERAGAAFAPAPHEPIAPQGAEPRVPSSPPALVVRLPPDGLLEPELARRAVGLPLPVLKLSPAGVALLRTEAYLTMRDFPDTDDHTLIESLAELGREMYASELRHARMPPVGGKIYLPVSAGGTVAAMLGLTARRLGMDGAYSGSLRTWLVRLPPSRSYAVAGRLIDAVVALRILPPGSVAPHHLTIQGDLGQEARILSILHLAATPLVFEERPGAGGDERPFIMRGGGVLDDLGGRGRGAGERTDFIDGFLFIDVPGLDAAEHRTGHTLNLRLKQVLAYALLAHSTPSYRRTPVEERAAAAFADLRDQLHALLARHGLERALELDWIDGQWSEIWPFVQRMGRAKEQDPEFLEQAQQLRDTILDRVETLAAGTAPTAR